MAVNTLAPGFVKLHYIGAQNIQHTMTFGVLNDNFALAIPTIKTKDGSSVAINTAVSAFVTILKALMAASVTFQDFDLWSKPTPTDDPIWLYNGSLAVVGTNAAATVANSQLVASYRSGAGGNGKIYLLEQSYAVNNVYKPTAYGDAAKLALANYLIGTSSMVYARDNGFPVSVPRMMTKTNDVMRKRFVLNA